MCNPESCPLKDVCEERSQLDSLIVEERAAEAVKADQEFGEFIENLPGTTAERAMAGLQFLRPALIARYKASEARERQLAELSQQKREEENCSGAKPKRRYGFIGRVVGNECGSRARITRLSPQVPDGEQVDNRQL